ncbi:MAG: hypothetical protein WA347_02225 [Rhabdochlamydiaceae bacterium]|jgi:hypothetical protein
MKKDQPISDLSGKSFSVAFEQMAQLLRTEVKLKDRLTKVLSSSSFNNSFKRIAKLLRAEVHAITPLKKRSWKKHSKIN